MRAFEVTFRSDRGIRNLSFVSAFIAPAKQLTHSLMHLARRLGTPRASGNGKPGAQLARLLLMAAAYFAGAKLGLYFTTADSHIALFWLPTGIATAILWRWGSPYLIGGILLGAFLYDLSLGATFPLALLGAAGDTLAPLTAVWLLQHLRFDPNFTRQHDQLALIATAVLSTLLPAAVDVGTHWLGGLLQPDAMPLAWLNRWLGELMSILVVSPLLLSLGSLQELRRRPAGVMLCALLLLVSATLAFLVTFDNHILPLTFLPLPLVLWAALRLGVFGASLSVLALSLLTAFGTATQQGVFGTLPGDEGSYLAWLYMFVVALIGLMATTMLGERKKTEASLQRANELLSLAQRASKSGVWDRELASGKLTWSDEMFAIFGLDPKTAVSFEAWRNLIHPEDRQAVEDSIKESLQADTPLFYEYRIILPGGMTKWILAVGTASRNERNAAVRLSGLCIDVTAQKEAQRRAQHSESRYKALLQQAADALFIHDFDGRILEVNQQASDRLGYSIAELCQMNLADISPEFDLEAKRQTWKQLEFGRPISFISSHRRKDGYIFPVEVRVVSLTVDNEKLIMGLANDITERKRIEAALQESEARYRNFAEKMPMGIIITQDGLIKYVNNALMELIDYSEAELLDKPFLPFAFEADRSWLQDLHQRRMQGEQIPPHYEVRMVRKDGKVRQWDMHTSTIGWEGRFSSLGIVADITERKAAEEKLHAALIAQHEAQQRAQFSESRYAALIEHAADAVFVFDLDARFVEVNQQACDSLGYSRSELLKMSVTDIVPGFDLDERQATWRALELGKPYSMIASHQRKDGTTFPVEVRLAALQFDDKKMLIALAADISTRVELDTKLRNSLRQLEEKELSKTRFLAAAGHDLRQPVAAANLFLGALKFTATNDRQKELIGRLEQSMNVFSSLLERLLDISKFDAGLIKPQLSMFNLAELFDWLEQNFEQAALEKQLSFRLFYPLDEPLMVRTDVGLMQSVVMNLVSNSIKFTSKGGILISARPRDDRILLQVWDTGSGIAETDLPYIFDEFYQAGNPERNRNAGLGLGLSICQRAMSLLGGKVSCRSRLGRGSVFELSVPLVIDRRQIGHIPDVERSSAGRFEASVLSGKRVVILEDDPLVVDGLLDLFRELGAEVLHFTTAEKALRHATVRDADFFVVDFSLGGGLSGIDFLRTVQQGSIAPIKAAVVTGETSTSFISHTRNLPWPVLHKPASVAQLLSSLQLQAVG